MATKKLHLREHRKAAKISAPKMAKILGVERESVLRVEREWDRCGPLEQIRWADALGVEPGDLWFPPGQKPMGDLDQIVDGHSDDLKEMAKDIVSRLVAGGR